MGRRQAKIFAEKARGSGTLVARAQHDRDTKFTKSFDQALKSLRVKLLKQAYRAPNTIAFVESFIQRLQQECVDEFIVFGAKHYLTAPWHRH